MTTKIASTEEAQRLVEEERNARARACLAEIMQVAEKKFYCRIGAVAYLTAEGRVLAQFRVVAEPLPPGVGSVLGPGV